MGLIQPLPEGPLDIIGDIHGEYGALVKLLIHLGYKSNGDHPNGRKVVFVGDYVDRGPDSPKVLALIQRWIGSGRAVGILGNHEINLLRNDPKEGSGWYFDSEDKTHPTKFGHHHRPDSVERKDIVDFVSSLPIGLERKDLRVIHAVWNGSIVDQIRGVKIGGIVDEFDWLEARTEIQAAKLDLFQRMFKENSPQAFDLKNRTCVPKFLAARAEYEELKQMGNPIKVLTSGVERKIDFPTIKPFFTNGKWRFVERVAWWNTYDDEVPVVVGHYWRLENKDFVPNSIGKHNTVLLDAVQPYSWHGKRGNVFCVDYSVGARWEDRANGKDHHTKLAALRWPERSLMFDDGRTIQTTRYMNEVIDESGPPSAKFSMNFQKLSFHP